MGFKGKVFHNTFAMGRLNEVFWLTRLDLNHLNHFSLYGWLLPKLRKKKLLTSLLYFKSKINITIEAHHNLLNLHEIFMMWDIMHILCNIFSSLQLKSTHRPRVKIMVDIKF